jgi:hypothetical protein
MNNVIIKVNTRTKKGAALMKYISEQTFTAKAIEIIDDGVLTDEEMVLPGKKVSGKNLDAWLKPSSQEQEFTIQEARLLIKKSLEKNQSIISRKK